MMYHFDVMVGASPDFATVNDAPFELYVGAPVAVQSLDAPLVKS